jgi:PKD repeat protein
MRKATTFISVLGLAIGLALLVAACSTDSPTAPEQNPPPPGGGTNQTSFTITITANPEEIEVNDPIITGQLCGGDSSTLFVKVRPTGGGQRPPNGTTVLLQTNLGSFEGTDVPVQEFPVELTNGDGFANFFACSTSGIAVVRAQLGSSFGRRDIRILSDPLVARFSTSNPEGNSSVQFISESTGLPDSFAWTFGDGQSSNEASPHHVYVAPGTYNVRLTVRKGNREDTCATSISTLSTTPFVCNLAIPDPDPEL